MSHKHGIVTNTIYDNEITNMVRKWQEVGVKSCSVVLNVRKQNNGVVEVQRQNRGVHWTSVVISFQEKKLIYCDSLHGPSHTI